MAITESQLGNIFTELAIDVEFNPPECYTSLMSADDSYELRLGLRALYDAKIFNDINLCMLMAKVQIEDFCSVLYLLQSDQALKIDVFRNMFRHAELATLLKPVFKTLYNHHLLTSINVNFILDYQVSNPELKNIIKMMWSGDILDELRFTVLIEGYKKHCFEIAQAFELIQHLGYLTNNIFFRLVTNPKQLKNLSYFKHLKSQAMIAASEHSNNTLTPATDFLPRYGGEPEIVLPAAQFREAEQLSGVTSGLANVILLPKPVLIKAVPDSKLAYSDIQLALQAKGYISENLPEFATHFCCPISMRLMYDPVVLITGHSFDRQYILEALKSKPGVDPLTNQKIANDKLISNYALRDAILAEVAKLPNIKDQPRISCG